MFDLTPVQLELAWIFFGMAVIGGFRPYMNLVRSHIQVRKNGGIWFMKCGRFGGSFYRAKAKS